MTLTLKSDAVQQAVKEFVERHFPGCTAVPDPGYRDLDVKISRPLNKSIALPPEKAF